MADPQKLRQLIQRVNLMTPRQKEIVERDRKNLEQALQGRPMPLYGADPHGEFRPSNAPSSPQGTVMVMRETPMPDRELLQRNYEECNRTLEMGTAPQLSGAAKNTLYQWFKAELPKFQEGMPSHDQMWRATWQNLQLYQRHKAENVRRSKLLANVHRALDPDDDGFHLEGFRPDKPSPFNGRAFREGWDEVQWDDPQELALQVEELDDQTYYAFVELKAQGITAQKIFESKLGITPTLYRACEARLANVLASYALDVAQAEGPDAVEALDDAPQHPPVESKDIAELTPKEAEYLQAYGDVVIAAALEQSHMTFAEMQTVIKQQAGETLPTYQAVMGAARATASALCKSGLLMVDGEGWRLAEDSASTLAR